MTNSQIIKMEEKESFKKYYQERNVTGGYDGQREGNEYRINKRKKELKIFLDLLDKKEGEKVLELGCSSGFLTRHLGSVIAIDTSKDMLDITKSKNPKAVVLEADMFKIPFDDNTFDKVITMRVWNHLNEEDLRKALREVKRVLKPNGNLVFDMEEKSWLRRFVNFFYKKIFKITGFKIYQYSISEMITIIFEEGFDTNTREELKHKIGRQIVWNINKN